MGSSSREGAWRRRSHSLDIVLVEVLHYRRLRNIGRRSLLEMWERIGMRSELRRGTGRPLISWKGHLVRGLRARRS